MEMLFLVSAVLGGTVFILQFVLAVVGFGADDIEFADDIPDDMPDDMPGDGSHGSTWLFGVISFRTIVAALSFFGLAGLGCSAGNLSAPLSLLIAIAAGAGAMYGVHYLMQTLYRLRHDGTVRIDRTVGQRGTVYIPIPANHTGLGKIQIRTQGRIMEYAAKTTAPERLKTGTTVEVVSVLSPMTLEVEPVDEMTLPLSTKASSDDVPGSVI